MSISSSMEKPVSLEKVDPELLKLLTKRQALLAAPRGPVRQAQSRLAKIAGVRVAFTTPDPAAVRGTAEALAQVGARVDEALQALARAQADLEALAREHQQALARGSLDSAAGVKARLKGLASKALTRQELESLAKKHFDAWVEAEADLDRCKSRIGRLEQELGLWFYRFLDWLIQNFSNGPTRRQELEEAQEKVGPLEKRQEKLAAKVQQEALSVLRSRGKALAEQDARRQKSIADREADRARILADLADAGGRLRASLHAFCDATKQALNANADRVACHLAAEWPLAAVAPWSAPEWDDWPRPGDDGKVRLESFLAPFLRVGELREQTGKLLAAVADGEALAWLKDGVRPITVPVVVPFIGAGKTLIVGCDPRTEAAGLEVLQMMVLRIAAVLGRQASFTLLDPTGHGQAFPMQRALRARKNAEEVNADLREVVQDIRRVNQEVLDGETGLHQLDSRRLASESFDFIVAATFPKGYDRRAIETLFNIAAAGPRAGRYVMLHYTQAQPLPREISLDQVENRLLLDPDRLFQPGAGYDFHRDELPKAGRRQQILDKINNAGRLDHSLAWDDLVGLPPESWWTCRSEENITTPIGLRGASDLAEVWFGVRQDRTCVHGMLAAMPGAGKSTLYHVLILGLAVRYAPEELRMYLIDGKFGAEFRPYERLPHAVVVSLNSPPELSRSVLEELYREMERRNDLFRQVEVEDFARYRQHIGKPLHRILLLIDEYQQLFEDDRDGTASGLLLRLATQGRSAGIHMFLGSQQYGAPGMLHQKDIFGNVHLKMAMKMQPEHILGLTEFGPAGKRLIRDCDVAGKFVLNVTGRDEESMAGKAAYLDPDRRTALLTALRDRAGGGLEPPVVFRGDTAPDVFHNTALAEALRHRHRWTPKDLEAQARKEAGPACGFGQPGWVAADRPLGFWLGRLFNVHGHAMAVLRRGVSQHLAVLGAPADARAGMLVGLAVSLAALYRPEEVTVSLLHAGADDEDPTVTVLHGLVEALLRPAGFDVAFQRDPDSIEPLLDQLIADLDQRKKQGSRNLPSRLALLLEPERMNPLRRVGDALARPPNPNYEKLRCLLAEGSQHGLHLVMVASALRLLAQVLDNRRDLAYFNHRVALQMSEDDSFALFRSRKAAQLQVDGSPLPCALYANVETNYTARFKPYAAAADLGTVEPLVRHLRGATAAGTAEG